MSEEKKSPTSYRWLLGGLKPITPPPGEDFEPCFRAEHFAEGVDPNIRVAVLYGYDGSLLAAEAVYVAGPEHVYAL